MQARTRSWERCRCWSVSVVRGSAVVVASVVSELLVVASSSVYRSSSEAGQRVLVLSTAMARASCSRLCPKGFIASHLFLSVEHVNNLKFPPHRRSWSTILYTPPRKMPFIPLPKCHCMGTVPQHMHCVFETTIATSTSTVTSYS